MKLGVITECFKRPLEDSLRLAAKLGFSGVLDRAMGYRDMHRAAGTLTAEGEAFFEGIRIQYSAILRLLERMEAAAKARRFPKAEKIARCLSHLRAGAPMDFYEALQLIYLYFMISECIDSYQVRSLGNGLDRTLLPFYRQDLEQGRYTQAQLREFLEYFLLQWSAIGNYWGQPFFLGGTYPDGTTRYNDLSEMILDVYDGLEIYNPKIQLKLNQNTPDSILQKAFEMIRRKNASIVFCCEPGMIKAVMRYGATYEEALDMDIRGCYETGIRGDEVCAASGYINAAKAVEYVFTDGFDRHIGKQVGLHTGPVEQMRSFGAFYNAFLQQWENLIAQTIEITNEYEKYFAFVNPSAMYSATVESCLQKAEDGYGGGVRFNNSAMQNCAFASAVDSLMAVKKFVYQRGQVTIGELARALEQNWEGYETLRRQVSRDVCKYGNGDPEADGLAQILARYFADRVGNTPNGRGGVYKAILHSARAFITQGKCTGALPDGRLAGTELSKNASPVTGVGKKGVTALLRSATVLSPDRYSEAFCLDVMLHPSALQGDNGFTVFKGLLMAYLQKSGQAIHFNIFDADTLRDAKAHPEKYRDLQVRVCGWNVLWTDLTEAEREAYIRRAEVLQ